MAWAIHRNHYNFQSCASVSVLFYICLVDTYPVELPHDTLREQISCYVLAKWRCGSHGNLTESSGWTKAVTCGLVAKRGTADLFNKGAHIACTR